MSKQVNFLKEPIEVKFQNFDRENPHVYEMFKKLSLDMFAKGHSRAGSKMLIEVIRWQTMTKTTDKDYKINNNYAPYLARKFVREFPQHLDKFNFRQTRTY